MGRNAQRFGGFGSFSVGMKKGGLDGRAASVAFAIAQRTRWDQELAR